MFNFTGVHPADVEPRAVAGGERDGIVHQQQTLAGVENGVRAGWEGEAYLVSDRQAGEGQRLVAVVQQLEELEVGCPERGIDRKFIRRRVGGMVVQFRDEQIAFAR